MWTVFAVGATPARASRTDMGMPVKRMSRFTNGSKMVAVLDAMVSRVFWSNASDLPTLWLFRAPSMRRTVLPTGFGTAAGRVEAAGPVVAAGAPAGLLGVLEPHPASAAASTATPITAYAVRFMAPPAPRSNGSGHAGRWRSNRELGGGTE